MFALWASLATSMPPVVLEFAGTLLTQILFYWIPCTAYLALDVYLPAFSRAHKLQPDERQPDRAEIKHTIRLAFKNQLLSVGLQLLNLVVTVLATRNATTTKVPTAANNNNNNNNYHSAPAPPPFTMSFSPELPSLAVLARDFVVLVLLREFYFYYCHRALHSRLLWRRVHSVHHAFATPIAFASQSAHPFEHLVANVVPAALLPKMLRTHVVTSWLFLGWILLETCTAHSGYDFFRGAALMHDAHHERVGVNYGGMGWMDWLHGTGYRMKPKVVGPMVETESGDKTEDKTIKETKVE